MRMRFGRIIGSKYRFYVALVPLALSYLAGSAVPPHWSRVPFNFIVLKTSDLLYDNKCIVPVVKAT